jgi:hypothetical protein
VLIHALVPPALQHQILAPLEARLSLLLLAFAVEKAFVRTLSGHTVDGVLTVAAVDGVGLACGTGDHHRAVSRLHVLRAGLHPGVADALVRCPPPHDGIERHDAGNDTTVCAVVGVGRRSTGVAACLAFLRSSRRAAAV